MALELDGAVVDVESELSNELGTMLRPFGGSELDNKSSLALVNEMGVTTGDAAGGVGGYECKLARLLPLLLILSV